MITFIIGLVILIVGGAIYGAICERVMKPNSNVKTPAIGLHDGVDFVPMSKWRNALIELLNIAGTGPVFGPIQGILFGPVAFLTIPIGCVIGGAVHDYMVAMISMRNKGEQTPLLMRRFFGGKVYAFYNVFVCLLLLLLGTVFIYTPGDLFVAHIFNHDASTLSGTVIAVYAMIFAYYLVATLFPIDKIIGQIYPIFGAILLLSAVGIFFGLFVKGYPLTEIWETSIFSAHPFGENFIPMFFVTVTCGIASGFHSTQATLISRTVTNEQHGRFVFYNMMIAEGFIAMTWSAAAMGLVNFGLATNENLLKIPAIVVGIISVEMLGSVGGMVAVVGVIILAITSGDTALRSLRIIVGEALQIDNKKKTNTLSLSLIIFAIVACILYFAKTDASGFSILWRYFSWANESIVTFVFAMITVYMIRNKMPYIMAIIPGTFYMYIVSTYILHAPIGFGLGWTISYILAAVLSILYAVAIVKFGQSMNSTPRLR